MAYTLDEESLGNLYSTIIGRLDTDPALMRGQARLDLWKFHQPIPAAFCEELAKEIDKEASFSRPRLDHNCSNTYPTARSTGQIHLGNPTLTFEQRSDYWHWEESPRPR
jgi:hypothetical protein